MTDSKEDFLGTLPDSPPKGVFTNRQGYAPPSGGGNYKPPPSSGVYTPPPNVVEDVGWEVYVYAGPDYKRLLTVITQHQGLMLSRELSNDGSGSITLNRDAPLFYSDPGTPNNMIPNPDFTKKDSNNSYIWGWMNNSRGSASTLGMNSTWLAPDNSQNNSLSVTTPGTGTSKFNTTEGQSIPVRSGAALTFTAQVYPLTNGRPTRLFVEFYDFDGNYMLTAQAILGSPVTTFPNQINYLRVDGLVPPGAYYAAAGAEVVAPGVAGEVHLFDNFALYITPEAQPFFDGRDKSEILDNENLWQVRFNGKKVHEFLGQVRSSNLVNPSESRDVTISGPGTAVLLKRALVLPQAWTVKNGQPWVVQPIKEFKDPFNGIIPKTWNKAFTEGVFANTATGDSFHNRLQLTYGHLGTEMAGSGPWNLKGDAKLPGDTSGIPNTLYFKAYPFIMVKPAVATIGQFHNVYEIYIDDLNRAFIKIQSNINSANVLTKTIYAAFVTPAADGKTAVITTFGEVTYDVTKHQWLRFRHDVPTNSLKYEVSGDGITWAVLGSRTLPADSVPPQPPNPWQANLDQVTFRFYVYATGIIMAYYPPTSRPPGTQGNVNDPANPGTLYPISDEHIDPAAPVNKAWSEIGNLNNNDAPNADPVYDQMGYFKWRMDLAQAPASAGGRAILPSVTTDWSIGNFKPGSNAAAPTDSLGNLRKGVSKTFFMDADHNLINPILVTENPPGTYNYTDPDSGDTTPVTKAPQEVAKPNDGDGETYYDYFVRSCNLAGCDWSMKPSDSLDDTGQILMIYDNDPDLSNPSYPDQRMVENNPDGFNKENYVLFHEGYSTISKQLDKSTETLVNYVVGHDSKDAWVLAQDAASIAQWGIREGFAPADYSSDPTTVSIQSAASISLQIGINELESWTISVPVFDDLRPFYDYKEGDWISIAKHTGADANSTDKQYDVFRVMAISLSIDVNGVESVELTLDSLLQTQIKKLNDKLHSANATTNVPAIINTIPPANPTGGGTVKISAMADVSTGDAPTPGSSLTMSSAGVWVATPRPVTAYQIQNLGDGATTVFPIQHNLGTNIVITHVYRMDTGEDITNWQSIVNSQIVKEVTVNVIDYETVYVTFRTAPASGSIRVTVNR